MFVVATCVLGRSFAAARRLLDQHAPLRRTPRRCPMWPSQMPPGHVLEGFLETYSLLPLRVLAPNVLAPGAACTGMLCVLGVKSARLPNPVTYLQFMLTNLRTTTFYVTNCSSNVQPQLTNLWAVLQSGHAASEAEIASLSEPLYRPWPTHRGSCSV